RWDRVSNGIALAVSLESQLERPLLTIQERAVLVSSCAAAGRTSCMAGSAFEHVMAWSRAERGIPLISRPRGGGAVRPVEFFSTHSVQASHQEPSTAGLLRYQVSGSIYLSPEGL